MSVESATSFVDPSNPIAAAILIFTIVGLLFAVVCWGLLVKWRQERVIKSASLPFSVLMCLGAIIGLLLNFLLVGRPTNGVCHARAWLMGLGFVIFIGNFLVKVWRIHVIFNTKLLTKANISDATLHTYFSILLAVQILLMALYSGLGLPTVERVYHVTQYNVYDDVCVVQDANTWNLLVALYAAALLIYGVYLAFQVRNLTSLFNEAKLLGGSIYNMIFVAVVCGPILLFLDMPPTSAALVRTLASFAMFTGSLAIVFVPKFCVVLGKTKAGGTGSGSDSGHLSNNSGIYKIDTESLRYQELSQLLAQKEHSHAFIRALDAELERRSHASTLHSTSPSSADSL